MRTGHEPQRAGIGADGVEVESEFYAEAVLFWVDAMVGKCWYCWLLSIGSPDRGVSSGKNTQFTGAYNSISEMRGLRGEQGVPSRESVAAFAPADTLPLRINKRPDLAIGFTSRAAKMAIFRMR